MSRQNTIRPSPLHSEEDSELGDALKDIAKKNFANYIFVFGIASEHDGYIDKQGHTIHTMPSNLDVLKRKRRPDNVLKDLLHHFICKFDIKEGSL